MREATRDKDRLEHILEAIDNVNSYTEGISKEMLASDKLRLHACVYNVQIIGEAVYKLTQDFKDNHPETPWRMIEKMRHILVHDYYQINFNILWQVIEDDLPNLKEQISAYI
ncbi:MAG: DUF86 domain-containing protein [Prevotella sp.]|nr:DUF86 domain-containing protein [Prevotella sp.]